MLNVFQSFPVSNEEYDKLNKKFGKLIYKQAWQLLKQNTKNNHTDELEDIAQEIRSSLLQAGSYFKRQVYIENCFDLIFKHVKDKVVLEVTKQLKKLWSNKTRHGAGKVIFGEHQEQILENLVQTYIPKEFIPDKTQPLEISNKLGIYCKSITWNRVKALGKKISKEKILRSGMVSISNFDYIGS